MTTPPTPPTPPPPPPFSTRTGPTPPGGDPTARTTGWPAPPATAARHLSRRALLLGAGGSVLAASGVTAWIVRRDATATSPSATASTSAPSAPTAPGSTAGSVSATTAPSSTPTTGPAAMPDDHVLVVVQLSGGNDALNTLVPISGHYHDLRPSLGLADDTLLALPGTTAYGLHPSLAPLAPMVDDGRLAIVAGIGFPEPDRSHFAALDMWWSGTPRQTFHTGWLGRWLDATATADDAILRSTGLGGAVPALRADTARSVGVNSLARFAVPDLDPQVIAAWTALSPEHVAAASAATSIAALNLDAAGDESLQGEDSVVTRLDAAAALILSDPGVRVVHVTTGGYDTHADQLATHARLLDELATGIARFQQRLDEAGQAGRVLLVTTSEFGRRVAENGSGGCDHGRAGVVFVAGAGVRAAGRPVIGAIDPTDTVDGDLRPTIDPRSLYATALDWLGPDSGLTDAVLGSSFERLVVGH